MSSRPIPEPTPLSEGFWAAAREHQLVLQRCDDCGLYRHYPQERCPDCTGAAWTWTPASGRGVVYTYTASHMPFHPAWAGRTPYIVATVELAEGVRMVSDLPPEDVDRVRIGSSVEVFFEDLPGTDVALPRFRLA
jgi:uncharacterized OB-fold protein